MAKDLYATEQFLQAKNILVKCLQLIESLPEERILQLNNDSNIPIPESKTVHPMSVDVLALLSDCYSRLSNVQKALFALDKLIKKCNWDGIAYIKKGKLLQSINKDMEAYINYKTGIQNLSLWKDKVLHADNNSNNINNNDIYDKFITKTNKYIQYLTSKKDQIKSKRLSLKKQNQIPIQPKFVISDTKSDTSIHGKRKFIDPIQEQKLLLHRNKSFQSQSTREQLVKINARFFDILANLPAEIVPHILKHLTVLDLLHLIQVCKRYRTIILHFPTQFNRFNLHSTNSKLFNQFSKFLIDLYSGNNRSTTRQLAMLNFSTKLASEETKLIPKLCHLLQNFKCHTLILSLPNCTTSHLYRSMIPNSTFSQSIRQFSLKIALRADKEYENNVLNQFNNLDKIELIFTSSLVPMRDGNIKKKIESINDNWSPNLNHLKLLCDSKKINFLPMRSFWLNETKFTQLNGLYITGVTFDESNWHLDWLLKFPNLKELWLEDNVNGNLNVLLNFLKQNNVFHGNLTKLTFRENKLNQRIDLHDDMNRFQYGANLQNLTHLDLMGTCVSGVGLTRLISTIKQSNLRYLNIGDCHYIQFKLNFIEPDPQFIPLNQFFNSLTNLEEFILPQFTYLNDSSIDTITKFCNKLVNLKKFDLSFNPAITGVSIFEFLCKFYEWRNDTPLDYLVVNGCKKISHITINTILQKKLVKKIDCIYEREVWKQFGINSYKYR